MIHRDTCKLQRANSRPTKIAQLRILGCVFVVGSDVGCHPTEPPLPRVFEEDFENGLGRWVGRPTGHHAVIVFDPFDSTNSVVYFTRPVAAGDLFSPEIEVELNARYTLTFDYLGLEIPGSNPDDFGGYIGIADGIPGAHFWLGGTDPTQAVVHLVDDGRWRTYSIDFVPSNFIVTQDDRVRVMLEDGETQPGVPRDAYFDNIRLERATDGTQ